MRCLSRSVAMCLLLMTLSAAGALVTHLDAHQNPCHRTHACPSDRNTYVCGDQGRCNQCPDNPYCLAHQRRSTATPSAALPVPSTAPAAPTHQADVTVCFTPGGNCTQLIVETLAGATTSLLVQAYSFTSAPIAKAPMPTSEVYGCR
jgi:hypothetical protein